MGAEEFGLLLATARAFQYLHDSDERFRIVTLLGHKPDSEII